MTVRRKSYPRYARSLFKPAVGVRFLRLCEVVDVAASSLAEAPVEAPVEAAVEAPAEVPDGPMQVDLRDPAVLEAIYEQDIKHGGLLIRTREAPEIDSEVVIPVLLPDPHGTIHCHGTVVKRNENPPSVAIRLTEIKPVRDRLMEIIADYS
jgi:Tfp pilus assembly protein PilZ